MIKKIKSFVSKIGRKGKALICCAVATVSTCAMAVAASAADTSGTTSVDTTSMMTEAGNQLTAQFSSMVSTIIPVILGILGSGLVIFGIFALIKLAKKIFGKVAG